VESLWRKTASLFLRHPILWLPFVCAHLLNASLDLLRRALVWRIVLWLSTSTRRSVLGGAPVKIHSYIAPAQIAWTSGLTEWTLRYLTTCISTIALVVTAAFVSMILRSEQPRLRAALAELRSYPRRILTYSFKLFFLYLAFDLFVSIPAFRLLQSIDSSTPATGWTQVANWALTQGQLLPSLILFAWIMTPVEIRLLRPLHAGPPSTGEKKLGRYFVILTGLCAVGLTLALPRLLFKLVTLRPFQEQILSSVASLLWVFPYLLGDIGVALIAAGWDWRLSESPLHSKLREHARILMPLHFNEPDQRS
jgi:hypothetical protein